MQREASHSTRVWVRIQSRPQIQILMIANSVLCPSCLHAATVPRILSSHNMHMTHNRRPRSEPLHACMFTKTMQANLGESHEHAVLGTSTVQATV